MPANQPPKSDAPAPGIRVSEAAPELPVAKRDDLRGRPFHIVALAQQRGGKFAKNENDTTWRVTCLDPETGVMYLQLFGGNMVRDQQFEQFANVLAGSNGKTIGPCRLMKVGTDAGDAYNIVDADDARVNF